MIIKTYPDGSELKAGHLVALGVAGVCYTVALAVYFEKRENRQARKNRK